MVGNEKDVRHGDAEVRHSEPGDVVFRMRRRVAAESAVRILPKQDKSCPRCGSKGLVTSTLLPRRQHKCKNPDCLHTWTTIEKEVGHERG